MKLSLTQKGLLLIFVPTILQVVLFTAYGYLVDKTERLLDRAYTYQEVFGRSNWIATLLSVAALSSLGDRNSGKHDFSKILSECKDNTPGDFAQLKKLLAENEPACQKLDEAQQLSEKIIACASSELSSDSPTINRSDLNKFFEYGDEIRRLRNSFLTEVRRTLEVDTSLKPLAIKRRKTVLICFICIEILIGVASFILFMRWIALPASHKQ